MNRELLTSFWSIQKWYIYTSEDVWAKAYQLMLVLPDYIKWLLPGGIIFWRMHVLLNITFV